MTINWMGWILSIIVLLLLYFAGYILSNSVRLFVTGVRAQGVVVDIATSTSETTDSLKTPVAEFSTSTGENLKTPVIEFTTLAGEKIRVTGHSYSASPSAKVGDHVTMAYSKTNPKNAQILLWGEFPIVPAGFVLGFALFILLLWIACILASGESSLNDPLNLLPKLIASLRLDPARFPIFFLLSIVIPATGISTYVLSKDAFNMRNNGIKVIGYVSGSEVSSSRLSDGSTVSGNFPLITFKDVSGKEYTIRGSTVKWLSGLRDGDPAEVIYLAAHPEKGILNKWGEIFFPAVAFGMFFVAFLSMLILILRGVIQL